MKYFIDTEFHEHKKPIKFLGITIAKVWTIDLISIGIVCEDGREFYAINRDLNLKHAKKNKWLKDNVLDKLPEKQPQTPTHGGSPRIWNESMRWLTIKQMQEEIMDFVGAKIDTDDFGNWFYTYSKEHPEFYAYYADYDWVAFCWIFGTMMQLPNGFPKYCIDLKQMLDELQYLQENKYAGKTRLEAWVQDVKKMDEFPKQQNEHNSLDDANWNKDLFIFLKSVGKIIKTKNGISTNAC